MNEMDQKGGHQIRVVVADDVREMRDAVARELESDYAIVRRVSDGVALVECTRELEPDLLVTDISMPNLTGIAALRRLRQLGIQTPAIIVSVCEDEEVVQEALALGVRGFVLKSRLASDLRLAAREVFAGRTFVSKPLDKIRKHIG
jgi:DNA-binding NarL/FixJ family response regulator